MLSDPPHPLAVSLTAQEKQTCTATQYLFRWRKWLHQLLQETGWVMKEVKNKYKTNLINRSGLRERSLSLGASFLCWKNSVLTIKSIAGTSYQRTLQGSVDNRYNSRCTDRWEGIEVVTRQSSCVFSNGGAHENEGTTECKRRSTSQACRTKGDRKKDLIRTEKG